MTQTNQYFLSKGAHTSPENGRCAMEWVAYLAGEPHSDSPPCVSPVLRRFGITLNDRLGDEDRQLLRPYLARCIGTAGDGRDPERIELLTRYVLRDSLPRLLDDAGCQEAARRVRELPLDLTLMHVVSTLQDVRQVAFEARQRRLSDLRAKIRTRWPTDAAAAAADAAYAAAADAAYAAAAYAAYAADAYAADAYAAADAAYAYAAYAADAYAAADAAYAAAAYAAYAAAAYAADAYAAADAAYAADAADAYAAAADAAAPSATYDQVYAACKKAADDALKPRRNEALRSALELFDRMLPRRSSSCPSSMTPRPCARCPKEARAEQAAC
jgi:hypothetical protein